MLGVWAKASILRYAISAEMRVSLIFFVSAPFVTEADKAKADRHSEHNPDVRIVQIGPQQVEAKVLETSVTPAIVSVPTFTITRRHADRTARPHMKERLAAVGFNPVAGAPVECGTLV
jgi:hypothetical protein